MKLRCVVRVTKPHSAVVARGQPDEETDDGHTGQQVENAKLRGDKIVQGFECAIGRIGKQQQWHTGCDQNHGAE